MDVGDDFINIDYAGDPRLSKPPYPAVVSQRVPSCPDLPEGGNFYAPATLLARMVSIDTDIAELNRRF